MSEHPSEGAAHGAAAPSSTEVTPEAQREEVFRQELQEVQARAERLLANWQRAQADFANFRKRVETEQQEWVKVANAALVASLLPVVDDMERALSSVADKLKQFTWIDGIWLIYHKLLKVLEAHGLEEIKAEDRPFDPLYHQAVQEVEGEQGKVVAVLQKGYMLHQRVLRHTLVTVGKSTADSPPKETSQHSSQTPSG
ncbi:MAG: nucleotide exchange factor GrpE [Chloroflexi bacterium]|nr:nucleotide exchange factor GrpE [Chloroflexota bacterium]